MTETEVVASDEIDLSPIETHLGFLLRLAQQTVFDEFHRRFGKEGLTPARYSVLALVAVRPGLRQVTLSKGLHIKPPNIAVLINAMEADGLIERQTLEGNRRERRVFLTKLGQATYKRLAPKIAAMEAGFAERFSASDLQTLIRTLQRLHPGTP